MRDFEQVTNLRVILDFMIRKASVIRVIQQVFIIVFIQFFIFIVIALAINDCSPHSTQAQLLSPWPQLFTLILLMTVKAVMANRHLGL